jgi:TetR/AcrR family transcriptional regulator
MKTAQKAKPAKIADKSQGRRPGRPRNAPGADSRERLLDAALTLFARHGVAQTSLNAIAREAGVTPAMLHYYFNSREQLLDVIAAQRFLPLRAAISDIFATHADAPETAITLMARQLAQAATQHPWFAPLWLQELTGESAILRQHLHHRFGNRESSLALATLKSWQQRGLIHAALSPALLLTSLMSLILVPFAVLKQRQFEGNGINVDADTIVQHALTLLRRGVLTPPARVRET